MSRPTQIIIDLQAIQANCALAQSLTPDSKTVAVVKADAYGHGAIQVALALEAQVEMLTVSCMEEAIVLREAGIQKPILLLEGCFHADEILLAAEYKLELVVHTEKQVKELQHSPTPHIFKLWLKIDTGMHRLGIAPDKAAQIHAQLLSLPCAGEVVLCSHLASADELQSAFTLEQLSCYQSAIQPILLALELCGDEAPEQSIANSAGLLAWPQARLTWNRPGIMLYGLSPFSSPHPEADKLQPAMSFKSEVIALRKIEAGECVGYGHSWQAKRSSCIATVAVGYGDGYPRTATSGTPVLINGHRASLVGRVSMDMICVDVTDLPEVSLGDEALMWGRASTGQSLSANEVASFAGTIGYELVTRMPCRPKRRFV